MILVDRLEKISNSLSSESLERILTYLHRIGWDEARLLRDMRSGERNELYLSQSVARALSIRKGVKSALATMSDPKIPIESRIYSSDTVGLLAGKVCIRQLSRILLSQGQSPPELQVLAIRALGRTFSIDANDTLLQVLKISSDARVIAAALESVGMIGESQSEDVVLSYLNHNESCVKYWAAYALGEVGGKKSLSKLEEHLLSSEQFCDGEGSVRAEVKSSIERIIRRL